MDNNNRPRNREKYVTNNSQGVNLRGEGLGTGGVGTSFHESGSNSSGGMKKAAIGGGISIPLIIAIVFLLISGKSPLELLTGSTSAGVSSFLSSLSTSSFSTSYSGVAANSADVDRNVAAGSRSKYTNIIGNGQDVYTLMIYLCGTDLESKHGMATADLKEIQDSTIGNNLNVIVYTGGCKNWKNSIMSNSYNQIYQIQNGQLKVLMSNAGYDAMTKPSTLTSFITYCKDNFPANRYSLIMWDHGGGSISGFGYDEKNKTAGSMNLVGINQALKNANVKFDFIGFDACLMATTETALMLSNYADYMIASEEEEPGTGWYYTNWVTALNNNTSMSTLDIGKTIIDDYTAACLKSSRNPKTTLSIVDLAEFSNTVPDKLTAFANSISYKISSNNYKAVSDARNATREFSPSSKIDQVDIIDLANNLATPEANALSAALKSAIKYNRASDSMTNSYGLSIYFPYRRASSVDNICMQYDKIGMNDEYSKCIKAFAKVECSGQAATGGSTSAYSSLSGSSTGSLLTDLLSGFLGGDFRSMPDFDASNTEFLKDETVSSDVAANYISKNYLDNSKLKFSESDGKFKLSLSEEQWKLVHSIDLNMFYDNGEGYVDLGFDNLYTFDKNGNLVADTDRTWLAINGQPVAYYHTDTVENGNQYVITGFIPVMLNGSRANLIVKFTNDNPHGFIAGAMDVYEDTLVVAKSLTELTDGDTIDFICDFYDYNGNFKDSYFLGQQMVYSSNYTISNVDVGSGKVKITYLFTDIYNQKHWTNSIER